MKHYTRQELDAREFQELPRRTSQYLAKNRGNHGIIAKQISDNCYEIHAAVNAQGDRYDTLHINGDMAGIIETLEEFEQYLQNPRSRSIELHPFVHRKQKSKV